MNTNQAVANQSKSGDGQNPPTCREEPCSVGLWLPCWHLGVLSPTTETAEPLTIPSSCSCMGFTSPWPTCHLGLEGVNLSDPSYMRTRIYAVLGVPGAQESATFTCHSEQPRVR